MEARNIKLYAIDKLIIPEDSEIDKRMVDQLAASLEYEGLREPLVVVAQGQHKAWIRHGVHRWAAAKKLGWRTIECVVDPKSATLAEHEARVLAENLVRHQYHGAELDAMQSKLIDLRTQVVEEKLAAQKSAQNVQHKTAQTADLSKVEKKQAAVQARKDVAQVTGKTEHALRESKRRHERRQEEARETPQGPVLDNRGVRIPDRLLTIWKEIDDGMAHVSGPLKHAVNHSRWFEAAIKNMGGPYGRWAQYALRWTNQLKGLRHELKTLRPAVVCPACGGQSAECSSCGGVGFLTYYQIRNMPELNDSHSGKLDAIEGMLESDDDAA